MRLREVTQAMRKPSAAGMKCLHNPVNPNAPILWRRF
jgi:hypothetical protein